MKFRYFKSIIPVKQYWNLINSENNKVYQTYEFNKILYNSRKTSISNIKNNNRKTLFVVGFDDNIPCCIAPLAINSKDKSVHLLGYGTNAGYLDFIYDQNISTLKIAELLKESCRLFPEYKFKFTDLTGNSKLFEILPKDISVDTECYAINLPDSYETYYQSLSKSTRQNIRTTYNRIEADSLNYSLKIYNQNDIIDLDLLKRLNYIYRKRRAEWYDIETDEANRLKSKFKEWQEINRDVIFQSIKKIPNTIVVLMEINNRPVSFMIGYAYEKLLIVPRLAIDTDYSRFSPGCLLLIEYIKQLYSDGYGNGFMVDLCRGNEKYKSVYGGKLALTYSVSFNGKEVMSL